MIPGNCGWKDRWQTPHHCTNSSARWAEKTILLKTFKVKLEVSTSIIYWLFDFKSTVAKYRWKIIFKKEEKRRQTFISLIRRKFLVSQQKVESASYSSKTYHCPRFNGPTCSWFNIYRLTDVLDTRFYDIWCGLIWTYLQCQLNHQLTEHAWNRVSM